MRDAIEVAGLVRYDGARGEQVGQPIVSEMRECDAIFGDIRIVQFGIELVDQLDSAPQCALARSTPADSAKLSRAR